MTFNLYSSYARFLFKYEEADRFADKFFPGEHRLLPRFIPFKMEATQNSGDRWGAQLCRPHLCIECSPVLYRNRVGCLFGYRSLRISVRAFFATYNQYSSTF